MSQTSQFQQSNNGKERRYNHSNNDSVNNSNLPKPMPRSSFGRGRDKEEANSGPSSSSQKYQNNDTGTIVDHEVLPVNQGWGKIEDKKLKENALPQSYFGRGRGRGKNHSTNELLGKHSNSYNPQKFQNNYTGAKKKDFLNDNSENLAYLCITCEKSIHKKAIFHHRNNMDHEVLPVNEGITKLEEKKLRETNNLEEKAKSVLYTKTQIAEILHSSLNLIFDPLFGAFESLKKSTAEDKNELAVFLHDIQKVMPEKSADFGQFLKFNGDINKLEARGDALLLKNQCMPFWLLSSWFKISLGLMLQSGKIVCTILENNSISTLGIQGDRILLPCLQKNGSLPDKDATVLPFNFMAYIFDNNPCAYMKISSDHKDMGYVFVRVDLETFWGRQFLEMCTGTQGHSYRNTRLFRICRRGKTWDHIWTGDYSMNDGSGGSQVIGDEGEPLHTNPKPIVKGLLAARYGYQDRSTIFRIYIGESDVGAPNDPHSFDVGAFGNVEDGMHIFCHMATLPNITTGVIQDVGRNFSLN